MSKRRRGAARRRPPPPPADVADVSDQWINYCDGRMFVVGYTSGGAPFGHVEWPVDGVPDDRVDNAEPF